MSGAIGYESPRATVEMRYYSNALDEIWRLRRALAYEARVVEAHYEGYKTFPKTRRKHAEAQVERMKAAARGEVDTTYAGVSDQALRNSMCEAGGSETLTRSQWEASRA